MTKIGDQLSNTLSEMATPLSLDIKRDYENRILGLLGLTYVIVELNKDKRKELQSNEEAWIIELFLQNKIAQDTSFRAVGEAILLVIQRIDKRRLNSIISILNDINYSALTKEELFRIIVDFVYKYEISVGLNRIFVTNLQIGQLLGQLVDTNKGDKLYDPAAGLGLMFSYLDLKKASNVILQDINESVTILARLLYYFHPSSSSVSHISSNSLQINNVEDRSVDLIFSQPPFGKNRMKDSNTSVFKYPSRDYTDQFIQLIVSKLSPKGKAYVVVPDVFLFSSSQTSKAIRAELLNQDWIQSIVSFPAGILAPYTSVKTSLLIINKNKEQHRTNKVLFIDAPISDTNRVASFKSKKIDIKEIARLYHAKTIANNEHVISVVNDEILMNNSVLQFHRYASLNKLEKLERQLAPGTELVKLGDVIQLITLGRNQEANLPILKIGDLTNPIEAINIAQIKSVDENNRGRLLNESAILVASVGEKLKPSFFKHKEKNIALSPLIKAYRIINDIIDREYLLYELDSDFFKEQLKSISNGAVMIRWSNKDFKSLKIRIPSLDKQKEIVAQQKNIILEAKEEELLQLREQLKVEDKSLEIISNFKHDFIGTMDGMSGWIELLEDFLANNINVKQPVCPPFDDNPPPTVEYCLSKLKSSATMAVDRLEKEVDQILEGREKYDPNPINVFDLLTKFKKELPVKKLYKINITKDIAIDDKNALSAKIDESKFHKVFINLIDNAIAHGFGELSETTYQINFKLDLYTENEDTFVRITYRNDGIGFPDGFTFDDFIERNRRAGKNGNTGIGGDRINRIIKRHNGVFRNIPKDEVSPFNINFEILIPQIIE